MYCPGAHALNPKLDVSQYAHTVWRVRDGFTRGAILAIAQTPDGYLWLGTEFGLYRFDGVRAIPWQSPSGADLPSQHIYCLLVTRDGTLWIGTQGGAASWKDGKLRRYPELDGQSISSFLEDREGTIWSSGQKDFYPPHICAIEKTGVHCYGDDGGLSRGGSVHKMYEDTKGTVWVVASYGIWRWRPGPPEFYPLPFGIDTTQGITEDDAGNLLLGLAGEIRRFHDGKTEAFRLPGKLQPFTIRTMLDDETVVSGSPRTMRVLSIYIGEKWTYLDKQTVYRTTRSWHSMKIERITSGLRQRTAWIDFGTLPLLPFL